MTIFSAFQRLDGAAKALLGLTLFWVTEPLLLALQGVQCFLINNKQ